MADPVMGCAAVVDVRLGALRRAIEDRDWDRVEWEYDRVQRAQSKLVNTIKGDRMAQEPQEKPEPDKLQDAEIDPSRLPDDELADEEDDEPAEGEPA